MEAIRVEQVIKEDGKVVITGLPYEKGQWVEGIMFAHSESPKPRGRLTVREFKQSGILGLWKDRTDIEDSSVYARQLREQAQKRGDIS